MLTVFDCFQFTPRWWTARLDVLNSGYSWSVGGNNSLDRERNYFHL